LKLFLNNKNKFFAKNHCEIQVRTILVCALYSIKYRNFLILANVLLWVGTSLGCTSAFHGGKEGGIKVLAGLSPSSQRVGSLLRTHWPTKPAGKFGEK
jgi:hypothetical protein